jgi:hypothetical protein
MPRLQHHSHPDGLWPSCDDEPPGVSIQPFSHADLAALLATSTTTKTRATPSAGSGRRRWWQCGCGPASAAPAPPRRVPAPAGHRASAYPLVHRTPASLSLHHSGALSTSVRQISQEIAEAAPVGRWAC